MIYEYIVQNYQYGDPKKKLLYEEISFDEVIDNGIAKIADIDAFEFRGG